MYLMFPKRLKVILFILMTFTEFGDMTANEIVPVITRDVVIIGGGSTGIFSAVQLQKAGKSVVVVEKENILGGHTNTYIDPKTKQTIDYGVTAFENSQVVIDYLNYLGISWTTTFTAAGGPSPIPKFFDYRRRIVVNVTAQDPSSGFQAYAEQIARYPQLANGYFLPDPVPDDLLIPFGEFAVKYNISAAAVSTIFEFSQGLGDFLNQPTLYVFKIFALSIIETDLVQGFIVNKNNDNYEIYQNAYKILTRVSKENVLLESRVFKSVRSAYNGVEVTVDTPSGRKLIKAKKLLITIPPELSNLDGFDLSNNERSLFSKFRTAVYIVGLVSNTGLPYAVNVQNTNLNGSYGLPALPAPYRVGPTVIDGVYVFGYGSPNSVSDEYVKADVFAYLNALQEVGIANKTVGGPKLLAYSNHLPFELTVPVNEIRNGFYKKLYALQGELSTYYTGAAFHSHNSGLLWQFTSDYVLPDLLKANY